MNNASYKTPSDDVYWIEQIPVDWKVIHLKNLVSKKITDGPHETPNFLDDGVPFLSAEAVQNGTLNFDSMRGYISREADLEYSKKCKPKRGDIFIVKSGSSTGKIGFVNTDRHFNIWSPLALVRTNKKNTSRFHYYFFSSSLFQKQVQLSWSLGTQPNIGMGVIERLQTLTPPLPEQKAIAAYLDRETERIDRKVALLEEKAQLYKELKQSLINETVTRGLDKSVALRPSGVDWIGDIPEHWRVERIGTAFDERSEKVSDVDYPPLSVTMQGIVPQLDTAAKTQHNDNRKRVAVGDYVINSRSDRRGSSGVSPLDGSVSVINIVLKPRKNFYGAYLHHLFRSYRFIEEFYRNGRGIVDDLWTTKYSVMKAIEFAFPPTVEEQQAIADYLDDKTVKIDQIVEAIGEQVKLLKELRKTLINDVVTGKIRVTETAEATS